MIISDAHFSELTDGENAVPSMLFRFARVFEGMIGTLPWSARAMVWWAQWLHANGPWLLAAAALLVATLTATIASPSARAETSPVCAPT